MNAIINIIIISAATPQKGAVTHHQDQSITLHSFNTTKATPNSDKTLIPEFELSELLLMIYSLVFV